MNVGNDSTVYVNNTIYPSVDRRRPFRSAPSLMSRRLDFHFEYLRHTLQQARSTFRLSVWFMSGGALVILGGAVLALVHAGNPDLSYLPYVTTLTGALFTVGGGALALHSRRTMANLAKAAEDNQEKIEAEHRLDKATTLIDRIEDPAAKDRLNAAAALKALGADRLELPGGTPDPEG
ncbi:hypothetical protein GTY68_09060 [Streptomyces sp. SID4926]|nr:hypothetical protein [Streptomyces sp. SID4926]